MPLVYSGQELPNYKRLKFFDKDEIDWKEPVELHNFYKALLNLHKNNAVADGETFILPTEHDGLMAFIRKKENDVVLVLINLSTENKVHIAVEHEWLNGSFQNVFSELSFSFTSKESFELQSCEYLVYRKNN